MLDLIIQSIEEEPSNIVSIIKLLYVYITFGQVLYFTIQLRL